VIILVSPVFLSRKKFPAIPCVDGGTPVMIDTLFGLVNEGMQPRAVAWNPESRNFLKVGRRPLSMPDFRYSGSKPSIQITTMGWVGRLYSFKCRVNFDRESRLAFSIYIGKNVAITLTNKTLICKFFIGF
jgi:hypothetical protein